jgi:hypothetical protein
MNGGVMACTFKYRYVVEGVNGRLDRTFLLWFDMEGWDGRQAGELLISDSKEET